jgi:ribosome-associated protein
MMLLIPPFIRIPFSEFEVTYARSSGPGGQNVNKVNSKALLRWNFEASPSLRPEMKARLRERLQTRLSQSGDLLIASDRFRDQGRNREDCYEKLREILTQAAAIPKARKKSKPSKSSVRRGKEAKSMHSQKKKLRSSRYED